MNKLIDRIVEILEEEVKTPRDIKAIFKGDPVSIIEVDMPAITVSPVSTGIERVDNRRDSNIRTIAVILVLDARKYMNASYTEEAGNMVATKIMEEEDDNLNIMEDTILFSIRKALNAVNTYSLLTSSENISYEFQGARGYPTIEATLTFSVKSLLYDRLS